MQISPRKFNIIVFVTILALIIFYFVFNLFLNNGMISVTGQTPFQFTVKDKLYVCEASPCEVKILQGAYTLKAKKEGYKEEEVNVLVRRKNTTSVTVNFEFVPMIRKLDARMHITINDANFDMRRTPLDLEKEFELRPLPKVFSDVRLSPSLQYAFFYGLDTDAKSDYFLDISKKSLRKLNLGDMLAYRYAPKSDVLYFVANDTSSVSNLDSAQSSQVVQSLNSFVPGQVKTIANFVRPLKSPKIFVSQDENFVAIVDGESGDVFLVNLLENSRNKILILAGARDIKFSPKSEKLLIGSAIPGSTTLLGYSLFDIKGAEFQDNLSIVAEPNSIVWRDENNIFYAVEQEYSPFQSNLSKVLNDDNLKIITNKNSLMVNYNLGFKKYSNLYEPKTFINRVDLQEDGSALFGDIDNVWEIKFQEG